MESFWEEEHYKGKNATTIKTENESHFKLIENYAVGKFGIKQHEVTKAITNKCRVKKAKHQPEASIHANNR